MRAQKHASDYRDFLKASDYSKKEHQKVNLYTQDMYGTDIDTAKKSELSTHFWVGYARQSLRLAQYKSFGEDIPPAFYQAVLSQSKTGYRALDGKVHSLLEKL